jgi:hypothetical protein
MLLLGWQQRLLMWHGCMQLLWLQDLDPALTSLLLVLALLIPAVLLPWCVPQPVEGVFLQDRLSIPVLQGRLHVQQGAVLCR